MPYIDFCTNIAVSETKERELREKLGKIIELIPGKTEKWLMIRLEDKARLGLGGDSASPAAMVCLKAFGKKQENEVYDALTVAVCQAAEELGVPRDRVYVEYEVTDQWGWNGKNFGR